jgi:hypothetical protein
MKNSTSAMHRLSILDQVILQIPKRILIFAELSLFGISIADFFDWSIRGITSIITVSVGIWAIRAYKRKIALDDIDIAIKSQQLERMMEENKERARLKKITNDIAVD